MEIMTTARALGLTANADGELLGAIDEPSVLEALTELASAHPADADLIAQAADRVRRLRSAGLERIERDSVFARTGSATEVQFRYRAEVLDVFTDLAIDVAGRPVLDLDRELEDLAV